MDSQLLGRGNTFHNRESGHAIVKDLPPGKSGFILRTALFRDKQYGMYVSPYYPVCPFHEHKALKHNKLCFIQKLYDDTLLVAFDGSPKDLEELQCSNYIRAYRFSNARALKDQLLIRILCNEPTEDLCVLCGQNPHQKYDLCYHCNKLVCFFIGKIKHSNCCSHKEIIHLRKYLIYSLSKQLFRKESSHAL